ncbi:hypothetical protein ACFORH_05725 [Amycolatopsis roodepoortensis]|uniref:DUF2207 domain-containing protein n=1 Tax=Amycolatopsis roodepoortensis TaxID=700274 RepID=A0ABR9L8L1_9PSEU|nr:hypothetical protein [Amycolatopsis roodepoortensis]MBE1576508.1 hypothetical protein [Amycolatopsis roodepoortensis]
MYLSPEGIQPVEFGAEWACLLGSLRYRQFDGRPVVHVSPAIWGVDPATIRQAAHDRRYVEIPPAGPDVLSFQFAPDSFPGRLFDYPAPSPAPSRGQWLMKKIRGKDRVWISLQDAKLSRRHVVELAGQAQMSVMAEFADSTDRVLLLTRGSNPPRTTTGLRIGSPGFLTATVVTVMILTAIGCGIGAMTERPWLLLSSVIVGLPLVLASVLWTRAAPKSRRVSWLADRFDGSPSLLIGTDAYGVSLELVAQIAAFFDYYYTAWVRQSNGRLQGMAFVKRNIPVHRGTDTHGRTSDTGEAGRF